MDKIKKTIDIFGKRFDRRRTDHVERLFALNGPSGMLHHKGVSCKSHNEVMVCSFIPRHYDEIGGTDGALGRVTYEKEFVWTDIPDLDF